jgi:Protein of unknown function (DUF2563)
MFVDTGTLHTGANDSHRAASHADDGVNYLAGTSPVAGMFGDSAAADAFYEAVAQAHTHHILKLRAHQQTLSEVGDKARTVATAFTKMEEHNASELKAVRCNSDT